MQTERRMRADHLSRALFDEMGLASQKQEFEHDDEKQ